MNAVFVSGAGFTGIKIMDRKDFLTMCRDVSTYKKGLCNCRIVDDDCLICYEGEKFYPVGLEVSFDNGVVKNTAIIHEIGKNSVRYVSLERIQKYVR